MKVRISVDAAGTALEIEESELYAEVGATLQSRLSTVLDDAVMRVRRAYGIEGQA